MRGSNSAWAPGPPLKRSRAATEENTLDDGEEDRVKLQEFSTASDEYVSGRVFPSFDALFYPGQTAAV